MAKKKHKKNKKLAKQKQAKRYYEAGDTSQYFKRRPGGNTSPDSVVTRANINLRAIARWLDENSDIGNSVLSTLEKKVIGSGLDLRPRVKSSTGRVLERFNRDLINLWWDFCQSPEVTRELSMSEMQRVVFRTFCRDGEIIGHHIRSTNRIRAATRVPYAVELLEADYLPFETYAEPQRVGKNRTISNSVEKDAWGRPVAYWLYKQHPGSSGTYQNYADPEQKRVMADDIIHYKHTTRIRQTRGVTLLAPALRTLESIKDYTDSELVASRVAAALTAFVTKSTDFQTPQTDEDGNRILEMMPGMIYQDLLPGEDVSVIDSNRPNPELSNFRNAMIRGATSCTHTSYSDVSKDYDGTYSSQRQEMVSQKIDYDLLRAQFISDFLNPVYREFIDAARLSGQLRIPASVDERSLLDPEWSAPPQPWIDPKKEADAWIAMHGAGLMSKSEIVEARGIDLNKLYTDLKIEQEIEEQLGLNMTQSEQPQAETTEPNEEDEARGSFQLHAR